VPKVTADRWTWIFLGVGLFGSLVLFVKSTPHWALPGAAVAVVGFVGACVSDALALRSGAPRSKKRRESTGVNPQLGRQQLSPEFLGPVESMAASS
jgi:hypothetical protein